MFRKKHNHCFHLIQTTLRSQIQKCCYCGQIEDRYLFMKEHGKRVTPPEDMILQHPDSVEWGPWGKYGHGII